MRPYHHFIESPEWWDVVAPGAWSEAIVRHNDEIVARLPYVVSRRGGLSRIGLPPLTAWNGPFFAQRDVKTATRIATEIEWAEALHAQLPRADAVMLQAPVEIGNLHGFLATGYALTMSYTYRIALDRPRDALWDALLPRTRQNVRKAEKLVDIVLDEAGDRVAAMVLKSFERQHIDVGTWSGIIARIVQAFHRNGQVRAYVAVGRDGKDHAAVLCASDAQSTIYVIGGADPELRSSNAQSLLLWHAIEQAHGQSALFDFAGSMKPSIAKHFQSFGAEQHVKLGASLGNRRFRLLNGAYLAARSGLDRIRLWRPN